MSFTLIAQNNRLEGKVAIVTGGASGIGEAAVRIFNENGAKVVIADIQDDVGKSIADQLGENATYTHCDVSNEDEMMNLIDRTIAKYGTLDIMYNNAGIIDRPFGSILDTKISDLEKLINVNMVGSFLGAKHAARVMIPNKKGCILFTTSACTAIAGISTHSYAMTKHAIVGLVKNLATELGQHGIRVNCVSPYAAVTAIGGKKHNVEEVGIIEAALSAMGNLKGKVLKAEDVAKAALYLVSDEANYVSGINLVVDGGYSVVNPSMMRAFNHVQ